MSNSKDKYATKAKKQMAKIDGQRVELGSAEWEFYRSKLRFYQFLEDRMSDPNATNPLDLIDWETFWPEVHAMLKKYGMVNMPNDWYSIAANDYRRYLENGGRVYKNSTQGCGYLDSKTNKFVVDPYSYKDKEVHKHSVKGQR